ncbi:VID27 cytoplasmic protein [Colletotrichum limetticola]|uniref:VID27 cytoplasmic protein n=1 Tax=Colletotrichum limetticola TaxID=1209924 RepID=A0ABQ9Q5U7_9PEZI|nr:VID27 cytoplasmic protein [Colletotrichum limetticola]
MNCGFELCVPARSVFSGPDLSLAMIVSSMDLFGNGMAVCAFRKVDILPRVCPVERHHRFKPVTYIATLTSYRPKGFALLSIAIAPSTYTAVFCSTSIESRELHFYDHPSGSFIQQAAAVTATVTEVGKWEYYDRF